MIGTKTKGILTRTILDSLGFVMNRKTVPPSMSNRLRSAIETDEPITDWIRVVSVVIRDWSSPLRFSSK